MINFKYIRCAEGSEIPFGYGVAWRDFDRDCQVLYPLPFNIIIRWLRDFRFWLMSVGRPGYKERIEHEAFVKGRTMAFNAHTNQLKDIYEDGYRTGFSVGTNRAFDRLEDILRREANEKYI